MQVTVNVECSPQEARAFLGLPDLTSLHEVYLSRMREFASDGVRPEDVERLYRAWGTGMTEGFEQWQRLFWQATAGAKPATR